jgi:hypothetical protein
MRPRPRHGPRVRLTLTAAALAALIVGYYLGQHWQRQPLDGLSAIVYPDGQPIDWPEGLDPAADEASRIWRLFLVADRKAADCQAAMRRFGLMMNRLAAWPTIQSRVRLTVITTDPPGDPDSESLAAGAAWMDVVRTNPVDRERLVAGLGLRPDPARPCTPEQLNSILVAPDQRRWALIPFEEPSRMAFNVQAVIQFVE